MIDEMLYDVGFLWILEEACIENTGNVAWLKMSAQKNTGNQGILEK